MLVSAGNSSGEHTRRHERTIRNVLPIKAIAMHLIIKSNPIDKTVDIDSNITAEELSAAMECDSRLKVLIARAYMMSITLPVKVTKA